MLRLEGQYLAVMCGRFLQSKYSFYLTNIKENSQQQIIGDHWRSLEMYRDCHVVPVHHSDLVPLLGFYDLLHIFSDQIRHLERLEIQNKYLSIL